MFEGWSDFYLVVGSAAAVLIGLIFVVVSLMNDRPRSSVLYGSKLYMGPIVLHMSFVLVLSAGALTPRLSNRTYAAVTAVLALWGLARAVYSIAGMTHLRGEGDGNSVHWTDPWYYGGIPFVIYAFALRVALAFWNDADWAPYGIAAAILALILLSVRNEYDLITWIAPRKDGDPPKKQGG
jgi:hypothetical protein